MVKKSSTSQKEIVFISNGGVNISRYHLTFMYVLILWPIIFLVCFVTQQEWFVGEDGYLFHFGGAICFSSWSDNLFVFVIYY